METEIKMRCSFSKNIGDHLEDLNCISDCISSIIQQNKVIQISRSSLLNSKATKDNMYVLYRLVSTTKTNRQGKKTDDPFFDMSLNVWHLTFVQFSSFAF